jgi:hypothetical protein
LTSRKPGIAADYVTDAGSRLRTLFSPVMRVIAIANDGVQKRAQDSHSAFNKEKRFEPEGGAVAKNADDDGLSMEFCIPFPIRPFYRRPGPAENCDHRNGQ